MEASELSYLRHVARGFRPGCECERLIQIRDENPDIFAKIPEVHRRKTEMYLERRRAHEQLKALGIKP
jgi:hypothetical protein